MVDILISNSCKKISLKLPTKSETIEHNLNKLINNKQKKTIGTNKKINSKELNNIGQKKNDPILLQRIFRKTSDLNF